MKAGGRQGTSQSQERRVYSCRGRCWWEAAYSPARACKDLSCGPGYHRRQGEGRGWKQGTGEKSLLWAVKFSTPSYKPGRKLPPPRLLKKIEGLMIWGSALRRSRQEEPRAEQQDWEPRVKGQSARWPVRTPAPPPGFQKVRHRYTCQEPGEPPLGKGIASKSRPDANTRGQAVKTQLAPHSSLINELCLVNFSASSLNKNPSKAHHLLMARDGEKILRGSRERKKKKTKERNATRPLSNTT